MKKENLQSGGGGMGFQPRTDESVLWFTSQEELPNIASFEGDAWRCMTILIDGWCHLCSGAVLNDVMSGDLHARSDFMLSFPVE